MKIGFDRAEQKLLECKDEIKDEVKSGVATVGAKVDAVDRKVSKLRKSGKSRSRYTKEARALCWNFWETASNHEEVWCSVDTRITFETVFKHYKIQLARVGIEDCKVFGKIVRAEERRRNRKLAAKREAAVSKISSRPAPTSDGKMV